MSGALGPFQEVSWRTPPKLLLPCLPSDWQQLKRELAQGSHRAEWYHEGGVPQGLLVYQVASRSSKVAGQHFIRRIELFSETTTSIKVLLNRVAQLAPENLGSKFIILTPKIGRVAFGRIRDALFRLHVIKDPRGKSIKFKHTELNVCESVQHTQKKHELAMIGVHYFKYIMQGVKPFEGRVNSGKCRAMKIGDILKLFDHTAGWGIVCEITALDVFPSFMDMLRAKGSLKMLPQLKAKQKQGLSYEQLLKEGEKIYMSFPKADRVKKFGAVAIGVKYLETVE